MRPALLYMGGKYRIASWVVSYFPKHTTYVEPFGGAASVLLAKKPSKQEVYNDLNSDLVNFFTVLRDKDSGVELIRRLKLTPFAREEFEKAWSLDAEKTDAIERARCTFIRAWMGVGARGVASSNRTGFRYGVPGGPSEVSAYVSAVDSLDEVVSRLRICCIENKDAFDLFDRYDSPDTLFYLDPPYNVDGRHKYTHELKDHAKLVDKAKKLNGFCVVSGYANDLYDSAFTGWKKVSKQALNFAKGRAVECLWLSPRTWETLQKERCHVPLSLLRLP